MGNIPLVICISPVKNEEWILHRFLQCANLWADHIIIADQGSDDASREIAQLYDKVTLIDNEGSSYNEVERQRMLIDAARKIEGDKVLIALDADEMLSANFISSPEWNTVLQSSPGTVIQFDWVNVREDMTYWSPKASMSFGYHDDGSEHTGSLIHSTRIPTPAHSSSIKLNDIKVLHYQYSDWERMMSKHRWYQCWERINNPQKRAIDIFRQYHHMYSIPHNQTHRISANWIDGYESKGIDMTSVRKPSSFRWDKEIIGMFIEHGSDKFKREAIWNVDWDSIRDRVGTKASPASIRDPRNRMERLIHKWLMKSQPHSHKRTVRVIDRGLKLLGW